MSEIQSPGIPQMRISYFGSTQNHILSKKNSVNSEEASIKSINRDNDISYRAASPQKVNKQ